METTDKLGLVHQLIYFPTPEQFYVICNCCPCCCVALSNLIKIGSPKVVKSDYIAAVNREREEYYTSCGNCVRFYYFGARTIGPGGLVFNPDKCFGCGLCVDRCKQNIIVSVKRSERSR